MLVALVPAVMNEALYRSHINYKTHRYALHLPYIGHIRNKYLAIQFSLTYVTWFGTCVNVYVVPVEFRQHTQQQQHFHYVH